MNRTQLRKRTNSIISHATKAMRKNIEKAIRSGSMDIEGAEDNLVLPKSLMIALLKEEIRQHTPPYNDKLGKQVKKDKKGSISIY